MAEHRDLQVLITSIDGDITHDFQADQSVDEVRRFSYDKLVKDKAQIPFENTWMEQLDTRLNGDTKLSSLIKPQKDGETEKKHDSPDLVLSLVWTQQGGGGSSCSKNIIRL